MLTKSTIDRAIPTSAPFVLWDDELGGFGCKVHPTGRRSFVVQFRRLGSRRLYQITLGAYGVLTVTEARREARTLLASVRLGGSICGASTSAALTVRELVDRYSAALKAGTPSSKRLRGVLSAIWRTHYCICSVSPQHAVRWQPTTLLGERCNR